MSSLHVAEHLESEAPRTEWRQLRQEGDIMYTIVPRSLSLPDRMVHAAG